jgi:hypothetical protein
MPTGVYIQLEERDGIVGKVCTGCGVWKSLDSYTKGHTAGGRQAKCRACRASEARRPSRVCPACGQSSDDVYFPAGAYCGACEANRRRDPNRRCSNCGKTPQEVPFPVGFYCTECFKAKGAAWVQANPEKKKAQQHRDRALKEAAGGDILGEEIQLLTACYGTVCGIPGCGETEGLHLDHVKPLARGGDSRAGNYQPLCKSHNSSKGAWHDTDYRPDGGRCARAIQNLKLKGRPRQARENIATTLFGALKRCSTLEQKAILLERAALQLGGVSPKGTEALS